MSRSRLSVTILTVLLCSATLIAAFVLSQPGASADALLPRASSTAAGTSVQAGTYALLSWNDLGMHCYNGDFADLAVLPPFNTLWAQVIRVGDPPQIVTSGIRVTYAFTDNTYSVGKSNFWTYARQLFGVDLAPNIGLTGIGLSGVMEPVRDHYEAVGIPLTEYSDSDPTARQPYQLATVIVADATTGAELARSVVVAPVSTEMRCDTCHNDTGSAVVGQGIPPTGKVETNILALHDHENQDDYPAGHTGALMGRRPILCAECHASAALGAAGVSGLPSLSNAMHEKHSGVSGVPQGTAGCYLCHPGPQTQCLRDVMAQEEGMQCQDCHGSLAQVAQNPQPWLNEPRCDTCHEGFRQDQALYRMSRGHNGVYCEGCHDSTHAIAPSREARDGIKFMALQGQHGTLDRCSVCHATVPAEGFRHALGAVGTSGFKTFMPGLSR